MADNLKPYDPNKGFISFRLNPDAIKEELISFVPYNRTLRHIYNNPEGDIRETAELAAYETPVLGSLLSGEPVDAAKEAFLLGSPIKAPAKFKKEISKLPKTTQFRQEGSNSIRAYDPKSGKSWLIEIDDYDNGRIYKDYSYNTANFTANHNPTYNSKEVNKFIDASNSLHKLNRTGKSGTHPLAFERDKIFNPYDRLDVNNPNLPKNSQAETLKEANELFNMHSGNFGLTIERRLRNQDIANKAAPQLKKGETLVADDYGNMYIRKGKNNYSFDINSKGKISNKELDNIFGEDAIPYSDPMLNKDVRKWQTDVKLYNAARELEDNYIYFDSKNPKQWRTDVDKAREDYWNALNGPYFEDIIGYDR